MVNDNIKSKTCSWNISNVFEVAVIDTESTFTKPSESQQGGGEGTEIRKGHRNCCHSQ